MSDKVEFKSVFMLTIGQAESGEWGIMIHSSAENKHSKFVKPDLKSAMTEAYKRMRKRNLLNRRFPPPEPGRIITLAQAPRRIITRNGR